MVADTWITRNPPLPERSDPTQGPSRPQPNTGLLRAPMPEWQQRQFERLLDRLSDWRSDDHEDAITLCRSEIIAILDGVKACRNIGFSNQFA